VDPEATPVCVRFCIAEALYFGDLDDANSEVSLLVRKNRTVRLSEELGTDCSVYFIIDGIASKECRESE
jgi:phenylacetyl-CoA:acceptor oxidoreductase subunit 1